MASTSNSIKVEMDYDEDIYDDSDSNINDNPTNNAVNNMKNAGRKKSNHVKTILLKFKLMTI